MAIQAIHSFSSVNEIQSFPNAAGVGVVGGTPYMRSASGLFALGLANFGRDWYVDTVNGSSSNSGKSPDDAFALMATALANVDSYDRVWFVGDVREELTAPLGVYNVLISGAPNSRPHDDNGSRWRQAASHGAATPNLILREQGWVLANFIMKPATDAPAVQLYRAEDAVHPDPSHARFVGMRFDGGLIGIENKGGAGFLEIAGCLFRGQTGANGGGYVVTSTSIAVPLDVWIHHNRFLNNQSHIIGPFSYGVIEHNRFSTATAVAINSTDGSSQGGNSHIVENSFNIAAAEFDPSGSTGTVTGLASDIWYNFLTDMVESGQPA